MERLTRRSDTGHAYYPRCFEEPCNRRCEDCLFDETICERLAAYEDSDCEPEEVLPKDKADEITLKLMRLADLESLCSYDRLRELAEADKDGRVVVLPCKVGDGLWTFCSHPVEQVYSFTVTDISTLNGRAMLNTSRCGVIDARDVGKTVFLTREEAEKALEAMKDG